MQHPKIKKLIWLLLALSLGGVAIGNTYRRYLRLTFENAILHDDLPVVESLLNRGVSPNEPVSQTAPLVMTLSRYQRAANPMTRINRRFPVCEDIALLLIQRGANLGVLDTNKRTVLLQAVQMDAQRVVRKLLDLHADISVKDGFNRNALHIACISSSYEIVKWLVDGGCDINAVDGAGGTPLTIAAQEARTKTVRLLVERGAKIDITNGNGQTPFYAAVAAGSDPNKQVFAVDTAKYLLAKGANPSIQSKQGGSVATLATTTKMMKVLQSVGIPFPAPASKDERVILRNAINNNDIEMALRCRASIPLLSDGDYPTAVMFAQRNRNQEILNLLMPYMNTKRFANYLSFGIYHTPALEIPAAQMIRETQFTIAASRWQEALMMAIVANRIEIAKAILGKGITLDYLGKNGRTPTIEAAISANPLLMKAILERHPDVNRKSRGGTTALFYAKRTKQKEVIRLLEAAGAKD
ncbi:hypothetical protein LBMAG21_16630 [Armatimonadota bacterium]|nr:hypothetical protein LBMAG21_16630 [Armatimonadota bacterium]